MRQLLPPLLLVLVACQEGERAAESRRVSELAERGARCRVIGDRPRLSVSVDDEVWFRTNCTCEPTVLNERAARQPDGTIFTTRDLGPVTCSARAP